MECNNVSVERVTRRALHGIFCDLPIIIILARAALIDRHEEDRGHEAL